MKSTSGPYDEAFYRRHRDWARAAAEEVVPRVLRFVPARSVVDVGCGDGTWLRTFLDCGVPEVLGLEGGHVSTEVLQVPASCVRRHDLRLGLPNGISADLGLSLEVAEHLPEACARQFVEGLVRLSPVVLFSAAIPGQGGSGHLNEQWPDYWAALFEEKGFTVIDCLRKELWGNPRVKWWYAQNLLLFARRDGLSGYPELQLRATPDRRMLSVVHPEAYRVKHETLAAATDPGRVPVWDYLCRMPRVFRGALARHLGNVRAGYGMASRP